MKILDRRRFLQIAGLTALGATAGLAGCSENRNAAGTSTSDATSLAGTTSNDAASAASASASSSQANPATADGSSLVLVFSRAGENYGVGTVEVGNTMVLAQMIAEKTGADLFEIERAKPYPEAYNACCDESLEEKNAGVRPELAAMPDISGYNTVYLGFPCWWGDMPMPVYTAIDALDWNGKTICPFSTHAGSGEAGMFATVARRCTGATVMDGLTVAGTTAQNDRTTAESQVDSWLASLS